MKKIRIKAYLIDFLVLFLVLQLINFIIPKTEELKALEVEQNIIMEDYMSNRIDLGTYVNNYGELYYQSSIKEQVNYLCYLGFMIIYFVIIPFLWKGRTLGCYLCHVQIERFDQGKLRLWQLLVRYSIVFGIGYILINNLLLLFIPSSYYFPVISVIAIFQFVVALFCFFTIIFRKEKRGLHELLSNTEITKIIEMKKEKKKKKEKMNIKKK